MKFGLHVLIEYDYIRELGHPVIAMRVGRRCVVTEVGRRNPPDDFTSYVLNMNSSLFEQAGCLRLTDFMLTKNSGALP